MVTAQHAHRLASPAAMLLVLAAVGFQMGSAVSAEPWSLHLRSLLQTGTGTAAAAVGPTTAISSSAAGAGDNNNFVGAAQQVLNSPQTQLAAKQLATSATGNLPVNSNDLNTLIQGVRATQTFSQLLANLAGTSNKQTSLQSTLSSNNIAGLYKQQTTNDQFKVGSPSGSVYWTAGSQPVPAPAQALAANVADTLTPSVDRLTQSLMALIPSPPPPPPPPTVITALAPLEEAATNRIASFLASTGQAAGSAGAATTASTGGQSLQQAVPTQAVPVTFTHSTFDSTDLAGRRLLQNQQQYQQGTPSQYAAAPLIFGQHTADQQQQQQQQQQAAAPAYAWQAASQQQQQGGVQQQQQSWSVPLAPAWAPQQGPPQQQGGGYVQNGLNWNSDPSVAQRADGSWAPVPAPMPMQASSAQYTPAQGMASGSGSPAQGPVPYGPTAEVGTGNPSPYGASSTRRGQDSDYGQASGGGQALSASAPVTAPPPSPSKLSFPPVTINGVNLPGWSLPTLGPVPPAPPLGPVPALPPLPQAPQPQPLPGQPGGLVQAATAPATATSFQSITNNQGRPQPLTQALAEQTQLPQLQVIGGGTPSATPVALPAANNNAPAAQAGSGGSALPGFPASNPNQLVWVGLGGNGKSGNSR